VKLARISGLLLLLLSVSLSSIHTKAQTPIPENEPEISEIIARMTPEEKVGQLFLLTFEGTSVDDDSKIFDLISQYHIGGVSILAENDNLTYISQSPDDTVLQLKSLTRRLQQVEWVGSQENRESESNSEIFLPEYIPLFIAISQEGDGYQYDQIFNGLTLLPNSMAIGATWNPTLANDMGKILGTELSSIGINLLLGPSLDVLETPQIDNSLNIGTRSFGGDPYWVGEMGKEFIHGVHSGSSGKLAVTAKHFPGHGGADRKPEEEVSTIRKTMDQLLSVDLEPFIKVTSVELSREEQADALLTSHIRFQGLQGNIRSTTRPISLDPQAQNLLMEIPTIAAWRENGGILISDNLTSQAIRKFYESTDQDFDPKRVALNAYLAGNDILYFDDFSTTDDSDPHQETIATLDFFAQKYREDNAFAQRVDESLKRILSLKKRLYGSFSLGQVVSLSEPVYEYEFPEQAVFDIARNSATLISPSQADLDISAPDAPNLDDSIVFISDVRSAKQCSQCAEQSVLDETDLQEFTIRRYGPQASGQISPSKLSSFSIDDLEQMLNDPAAATTLGSKLDAANWIVFTMLDNDPQYNSYETLKRFLDDRADLYQQKRMILFSLNAPYFLDATDISKLTAYYTLYSKSPQFIDLASYILFKEIQAQGHSPVSIPGINYDLKEVLLPRQDQVIPMQLIIPEELEGQSSSGENGSELPVFNIGDVINVTTGVIFDNNNNPVPDGTPVEFVMNVSGESSSNFQVENTSGGSAGTSFGVSNPGAIDIFAQSGLANSEILRFEIPNPAEATLPIPTTTAMSEGQQATSPAPEPRILLPVEPELIVPKSDAPGFRDWFIAMLITILLSWFVYRLAIMIGQVRWGVRAGMLSLIGGMSAYTLVAIQSSPFSTVTEGSIARSVVIFTLTGIVLGLIVTFAWRALSQRKVRKDLSEPSI
jgi:beta-N-acetylhexosaminidase